MEHQDMKEEMLHAIALQYPFSLQEIYEAYQRLESYDLTIRACEMAREHFVALVTTVEEVLIEKNNKPESYCCATMEKARKRDLIHKRGDCLDGSLWISHHDGTSLMSILFCPFCGKKLSEGEA